MYLTRTIVMIAPLIPFLVGLEVAHAQCEIQKLIASDGEAGDAFGIHASVSGDVAVVAAFLDDDNGTNSGSAYVFRWNGSLWVQEQKLLASDGAAGDAFGHFVSVSGSVVVLGTGGHDHNGEDSGSAYVFRWNGSFWVEEQELLASDGAAHDVFDQRLSVYGDVVAVGAAQDDDNGQDSGSVYVFRWNGSSWAQEQKLLASDGAEFDQFGISVSVSDDVAVVGAWRDDDNGSDSGSAYVFRWNGSSWMQEQKLLASDGGPEDLFGMEVSVSGDVAIVAAVHDDDNGSNSGSAYVFRWNGSSWVQEQKLLAADGSPGDEFGRSVFVAGNVATVGAWLGDGTITDSGSAYVFRYHAELAQVPCVSPPSVVPCPWVQEHELLASDAAGGDSFGWTVPFSGNVAVVGAHLDDDNGTDSGSAYVYSISDCIGNSIPTVSEWGLITMTVLLLTAGTVVFRARRTATG